MPNYLEGLNEQQLEAVLHKDGPLMIVAGAGSGKTKVLTTRIAHLMSHHHIDAFNILALTFTNKAAAEMKERIEKLLGNSEARNLYVGTFHSVFARVLRIEAAHIGYPSNFTIYDTDDSRSVIKTVVNELNLDDKTYKPNVVGNRISAAKNALVSPAEYKTDSTIQQEDERTNRPMIGAIYDAYVKRCFKNGAMDFDDLLYKMYELLNNNPAILHKYQHKFKYVLVDEYQDTNTTQYMIVKLLAAVNENICVVGDDAQSIYSFRGATIENILQFNHDYEDVKTVKLEQNYRSKSNILNVANEIISFNKGQIQKNLWTNQEAGDKIKQVRVATDNEEGKFTADAIQEQKLRNHYNNRDFAILYRTNAQSRAFEESLRRMNIAYRIYGGISFFTRKEIKDYVAYLRIIINSSDEEALKRIINYPVRGIGKTTIEKIAIIANEQNITMYEVIEKASAFGFKAGTLELLTNFVQMIKYFRTMLATGNAYDVAVQVGKHTNMVKELFNDKSAEGMARYENIQSLLNGIKEFTETPSNEEDGEVGDKSLGAYLQQITLLTDVDNDKDPNADVVKLMTVHAAKGLEFPCVFVAGMEETLFPSGMSVNTREELEEERRLFYVAVTRAKAKLWITYAQNRYRFGQLTQNEPSRFLQEMPDQFVDKSFAGGGVKNQGFGFNNKSAHERMNGGFGNAARNAERQYGPPPTKEVKPFYTQPPKPKDVIHTPAPDFVASDTSNIQINQKIEHQKFGFGTIKTIEGSAHNPVATIEFEQNGEKKIMLNYAKLRIIEG
jgi:DNA helicase II / ATP-dependent DNA helicase PcrA